MLLDLQHHCGPLPLDLFIYLRRPNSLKADMSNELISLPDDALYKVFIADLSNASTSTVPDSFFLVQRTAKFRRRESAVAEDDKCVVDFKSPFAEGLLRTRFANIVLDDAQRLFRVCTFDPEVNVLGGWIFEAQAILYTACRPPNHAKVFGPFKKMSFNGTKHEDHTFRGSPSNQTELRKDCNGELKFFDGMRRVYSYTPATPTQLPVRINFEPFRSRTIQKYDEIADITLNTQFYYVPKKTFNPLFDAFFFSLGVDIVNIHFLQMYATKRHEGTDEGLQLAQEVKELIDAHYQHSCTINVHWVLVAPAREHSFSWVMPPEWSEKQYADVTGEVFIQYLNLNIMKK
ncbi:hypothetical protein GYMLUDRAFT_247936 [Collybiopsis luxurians FD-317 M1]|uniref:Uncharacterized protein n=1 Tax=Collybiopsis luxurians FD-317 M1 TaxID=944289 RepID=A0A0D0BN96_9AGAR|nr:hypothetical protein GYMLUDRAFT_247936 [Collybiopsis luxurians FD-317 M1]